MKALGLGVAEDHVGTSDEELLTRYRDSADAKDFNELVRRYGVRLEQREVARALDRATPQAEEVSA